MIRRPVPALLSILACLAIALLAARPAQASRFQVSPVRVSLSDQQSSALLTIKNQSNEPLRFQVSGHQWNQGRGGDMQLNSTSELSFFPSMLTVPAGASRKLRVATLVPQGPAEKTYRVFVEELPPLKKTGENGVRVLTRMGIPIFLAAQAPTSTPVIEALSFASGQLGFVVRNTGNTHFMNQALRVVTTDSTGRVTLDVSEAGWYVLGRGIRVYSLQLPDVARQDLSGIVIAVETDRGSASAKLDISQDQSVSP